MRLSRMLGHDLRWVDKVYLFGGWPVFHAEGPIVLGRNCRIRGGPARTHLTTRPNGRIEFGADAGISFGGVIYSEKLVTIGDRSSVGPYVTIFDTSFHPVDEGGETKTAPIEIGRNVWIGRHVMILPGVRIGDHSVVGSGAVVSREVPPRTLVAGNPARPVRKVTASDDWQRI